MLGRLGTCAKCLRSDVPLRYGGGRSGVHTHCTSTKRGCKDEGRRLSAEMLVAPGKRD